MRVMPFVLGAVLLAGCSKDKFTTAPQIEFKKFSTNYANNQTTNPQSGAKMTIKITDSEGDLGTTAKDTSFIYVYNPIINKLDSENYLMPNIQSVTGKNFEAEIDLNLYNVTGAPYYPPNQRPKKDTIYFKVWVKDFAKHKSNEITAPAFIYETLP